MVGEIDEDGKEVDEGQIEEREGSDRDSWDEFVSSQSDYVGATFGGQHLDPELMRIAGLLSGSPQDKLPVLLELRSKGLLNLQASQGPAAHQAPVTARDPIRDLEAA